jgi:predicted RNase H-like HicB family nuclease
MPTSKKDEAGQYGDHHHLTLEISKGAYGDVYIAQVKEIPGLIVQADSKDKLEDEIMKSYNVYIKAFPEEHDKIFHKKQSVEYLQIKVPHQ